MSIYASIFEDNLIILFLNCDIHVYLSVDKTKEKQKKFSDYSSLVVD